MENKDKEIKSLGGTFEVIDEPAAVSAPASAAPAAAAPRSGAPQPVRQAVVRASMGLAIGIAGLVAPYGAPQLAAVGAFAAASAIWALFRYGVLRAQPTAVPLKPVVPALVLAAGALGLVGALSGGTALEPGTFGNTGPGMLGAILALLGGAFALAAPAMAKKSDAKLPPAGPEFQADHQFSVSLYCYLIVLAMLPMAWSSGGGTGTGSILGALTLLFCLMGVVASLPGMYNGWAMRAVTSGLGGMVLFLAPLEAFLYGFLGVARVAMGDGAVDAIPTLGEVWPGSGDQNFLQYGLAPLATLLAGLWGTVVLFQGAKKGLEANKKKKDEEIAARKTARAARRDSEEGAGTPSDAKKPAEAPNS